MIASVATLTQSNSWIEHPKSALKTFKSLIQWQASVQVHEPHAAVTIHETKGVKATCHWIRTLSQLKILTTFVYQTYSHIMAIRWACLIRKVQIITSQSRLCRHLKARIQIAQSLHRLMTVLSCNTMTKSCLGRKTWISKWRTKEKVSPAATHFFTVRVIWRKIKTLSCLLRHWEIAGPSLMTHWWARMVDLINQAANLT